MKIPTNPSPPPAHGEELARNRFRIGQVVRATDEAREMFFAHNPNKRYPDVIGEVVGFGRDGISIRVGVGGRMPRTYRMEFWR